MTHSNDLARARRGLADMSFALAELAVTGRSTSPQPWTRRLTALMLHQANRLGTRSMAMDSIRTRQATLYVGI